MESVEQERASIEALTRLGARRKFIQRAGAGTLLSLLGGGIYTFADDFIPEARAATRPDGRPRVPPGQRVLQKLKPMGGMPGDPRAGNFRLKIHGEVDAPFEMNFSELASASPVELSLDVHCVTGWSVLDAKFKGVRLKDLAELAQVRKSARFVIFEAAHGYTANMSLSEALNPNALVAWQLDGRRLERGHGAPVRAINPDHYFWKSPKWLTGIRFSKRDAPGYWEVRGYHNHADPWKEERHG